MNSVDHSKRKSAPLPSQATLACLLALLLFYIIGGALHAIAPVAPPVTPELAHKFLIPSDLRPEPQERFVYIGLLLAAFPIGFASVAAAMRLRLPTQAGKVDVFLVLMLPLLCLAVQDWSENPPWLFVVHLVKEWPKKRLLLLLMWMALVAWEQRFVLFPQKQGRLVLTTTAILAAALVPFSFNLFGASLVDDRYNFVGHWDAIFYSIVQIHGGMTCLVTIVPQYGCYGEFLHPVFAVIGLSVAKASAILTLLQCLCCLGVVYYCFKTLRPFAATAASLWFIIATSTPVYFDDNQYFQYLPVRLLFPLLSLFLLLAWQRKGNTRRAFVTGTLLGLGIFWNLDSGLIVALAFGALVLFSQHPVIRPARTRLRHVLGYAGGLAAGMILFCIYLTAKSGSAPDLGKLFYYQSIFFGAGFVADPLPPLRGFWGVGVAILIVALALAVKDIWTKQFSRDSERMAYLALLGSGLLSYFINKSNPYVFLVCGWPCILLVFMLLERAAIAFQRSGLKSGSTATQIIPMIAIMLALAILYGRATDLWRFGKMGLESAWNNSQPSPVNDAASFIKSKTAPGTEVALFAHNQASILAQAERSSAVPGAGMIETVLRTDSEKTIAHVVTSGPHDLFIGADVLRPYNGIGFELWVKLNFDKLKTAYILKDVSPGGRMMHFVRR